MLRVESNGEIIGGAGYRKKDFLMQYNATKVTKLLPAGMSDHFCFRDNEMLLSNFQESEDISGTFHLVLG